MLILGDPIATHRAERATISPLFSQAAACRSSMQRQEGSGSSGLAGRFGPVIGPSEVKAPSNCRAGSRWTINRPVRLAAHADISASAQVWLISRFLEHSGKSVVVIQVFSKSAREREACDGWH